METSTPANPQKELPNSTAVLVLGIISIASCWCWGIPGLTCGIVAIVLASKSEVLYSAEVSAYKAVSYSNLKAGKICAIIGVCLSGLIFISVVIKIALGAAFLGFLSNMPFWDHLR
jgi:hypothetical protein